MSLLPIAGALLLSVSHAEEPEEEEETPDYLSRHRTPFGVLAKRTVGTASRPVAFNWRRTNVHLAATGDHLFELNNFNSLRAGGMARVPGQNMLTEIGLGWVWAWDTPSSELLAYTPYRQPGRPSRVELDLGVAIPFAEGLVTTYPRWFPAVELVFNVYAGFRYLFYPRSFGGMKAREVMGALFAPMLTQTELDNLEDRRLDAMAVDTGRYGLMVGFGDDIYFAQGFFISPRVMLSLPLLAPATGTELLLWGDLSLVVGVAL